MALDVRCPRRIRLGPIRPRRARSFPGAVRRRGYAINGQPVPGPAGHSDTRLYDRVRPSCSSSRPGANRIYQDVIEAMDVARGAEYKSSGSLRGKRTSRSQQASSQSVNKAHRVRPYSFAAGTFGSPRVRLGALLTYLHRVRPKRRLYFDFSLRVAEGSTSRYTGLAASIAVISCFSPCW